MRPAKFAVPGCDGGVELEQPASRRSGAGGGRAAAAARGPAGNADGALRHWWRLIDDAGGSSRGSGQLGLWLAVLRAAHAFWARGGLTHRRRSPVLAAGNAFACPRAAGPAADAGGGSQCSAPFHSSYMAALACVVCMVRDVCTVLETIKSQS